MAGQVERPLRAADRFQQRHAVLAVPVAVVRKFGDDQAGQGGIRVIQGSGIGLIVGILGTL
jgi:hypothetical protein